MKYRLAHILPAAALVATLSTITTPPTSASELQIDTIKATSTPDNTDWQLLSRHIKDGNVTERYSFGSGSVIEVTRSNNNEVHPYVSGGADQGGYFILFSKEDQQAFIGGGVTAVAGLAGLLAGPLAGLGASVLGSIISPYFQSGAPCAARTDGLTSWKVYFEPGPADPGYTVTDVQCVAP